MHPDIWIPGIEKYISAYGVMMVVGLLSAILLAEWFGKKQGCRKGSFWTLGLLGFLTGMLGCRLMYVYHHAPDLGLIQAFKMAGGGEILGGVLLASFCIALYLWKTKRPVRLYMDVAMPGLVLAMGIGRIGCFMFGCCWGGMCETEKDKPGVPWAVQFPYGSPVWVHQHKHDHVDCSGELLWNPPVEKGQDNSPKPIPREMLRENVQIHPAYLKLAEAMAAYVDTRATDENDPSLPELKEEVSRCQNALRNEVGQFRRVDLAMANQIVRLNQYGRTHESYTHDTLRNMASDHKTRWVHPAQLYDFVSMTMLFLVLSTILMRRKHHGVVVAWGMILYSISRYCMEMIRSDNPHDVGGFTVSQAISIGLFVGGWVLLLVFIKVIPDRHQQPEVGSE